MKKMKLLSALLSVLLAASMILALVPAAVQAESALGNKDLYKSLQKLTYVSRNGTGAKVYRSPEEKLSTMTKAVENDRYALYIQEFTAEVCIVDKITGQRLFTNPWDVEDSSATWLTKVSLLSQIIITYTDKEGISSTLESYYEAAENEQIQIKLIRNGVRVEYTLGEGIKKRIVPHQIEKSRFEEMIMRPFYEATTESDLTFDEYMALRKSDDIEDTNAAADAESFEFSKFIAFYSLFDLSDPGLTAREQATMLDNYPITEKMAIYLIDDGISARDLTTQEDYIKQYTSYSLEDMLADHEETEYELEDSSPAVFKMALEYTLEEDGFQVRLPARGISYDAATYTLGTIQVLPFLGAGRTADAEKAIRSDKGYNFVPDGSGAIIDFAQNAAYTRISGTLYGSDYGFYNTVSASTASYSVWRAPVYGTVMESHYTVKEDILDDKENVITAAGEYQTREGFVAFMTEGESLTRIDSVSGGGQHQYSSTSTTYFARQTDSYPLDGISVSGGTASVTKAIERKYVGNYTVKYRLLWEDEASYIGMANAYRDYLIKEGVLEETGKKTDDISLYLDVLGDIDTTVQILGVPIAAKAVLTSFEDAEIIVNELKEAGVSNQVLRYVGWMNGGMASTVPSKMKVEKALGGKAGLEKLIQAVREQGDEIFMDFDFAYVDTVGNFDGFDEGEDTAKTIDGKSAFYKTYNPIVQSFNSQVAFVVASNRILPIYEKVTQKYGALFGEGKKTISVGSLGGALSSNQDENFPMNREDSKSYVIAALERIAADYDQVMIEDGNAYTWKYADHILNIPLDSSNRNNTTAEVPFLGILLHGYMNYAGAAINLAGDYEYNILKTIESGADPYFVVAYENTGELKTNGYGEYYAVNYETWKDSIISEYKRLNEALKPLQGSRIIDHQILENRVVKVTYENGYAVYLNYNNFDVTEEGHKLSAMDFVVTEVR